MLEHTTTPIEGLLILKTRHFEDERGFFTESYNRERFEKFGIAAQFVQDNHSLSKNKGTVRGLHFQDAPMAQAKLIRVIRGAVWDVAIDLRPDSNTFGKLFSVELSETNQQQLFVPKGLAHGFMTLTDNTHVTYKVDEYYSPEYNAGIIWNDSDLAISWPLKTQVFLSEQDKKWPSFKDWKKKHGIP